MPDQYQSKLVILCLILIPIMGCHVFKKNVMQRIDYNLVNIILSEFKKNDRNCLNPNSTSFTFKFPEVFDKYDQGKLSKSERIYIEHEFAQGSMSWDFTKIMKFRSGSRKDCINLSRPIVFRNDTLAFIYISDGTGEFYNLYERNASGWHLLENLITTLY
jgi:hypothetical protein